MTTVTADSAEAPAQAQAAQRRRLLDSLPTRARTTGEQAAARSRLIRRLRIALPAFAIVLVTAFILNTRSNQSDPAFLEDFEDLSASTEELRMASPRFSGVDDRGQPFEITANAARQRPGGRNLVELDRPRAVQGGKDSQTVVTAEKGLYKSDTNILELEDGVTLEHKIGADTYVLRSPNATVSIKDQVVVSDAGVGGEGPDGSTLKAEHMTAYRAEGRVVLEGNVSMRIYPKTHKTDSDAGENDDDALSDEQTDHLR